MFLARQRVRGTPCSLKLPNGKNVPFDPEGAVHFGECGGAVLFTGRGAGGYWFIPPGVAGLGWLLWHWPWSDWDERPVAEGGDGPWEIQGSLVATGIKRAGPVAAHAGPAPAAHPGPDAVDDDDCPLECVPVKTPKKK